MCVLCMNKRVIRHIIFFQLRNIHGTITTRVHKLMMDDGHGLYFTIVNNIILPVMCVT